MCINLLERYGSKYRVEFDPAYSAAGVPRSKLDPHYMHLDCQKGIIFPYGGTRLTAEVEGRRVTCNKLRSLACTTVTQDGDMFLAVTFDEKDFDEVAKVMQPRRKRQISQEQRDKSRGRMVRFNQQTPHPASVKRPRTHRGDNRE